MDNHGWTVRAADYKGMNRNQTFISHPIHPPDPSCVLAPPRAREMGGHRLAVAVAVRLAGGDVVASHWSAAVLHRLPAPRVPHLTVELTTYPAGRQPPSGEHARIHLAALPAGHVVLLDGLRVTSAARTVVDLARRLAIPDAITTLDAALRLGLTTRRELETVLAACDGWPGADRARTAVRCASGQAATVPESRARAVLVHELALPPPMVGPWILDAGGRPITRVAMLWPRWRTIGEPAESDAGYGTAQSTSTFLRMLRHRELRALGYRVVLWTRRDLDLRPQRVAERIRPASHARREAA